MRLVQLPASLLSSGTQFAPTCPVGAISSKYDVTLAPLRFSNARYMAWLNPGTGSFGTCLRGSLGYSTASTYSLGAGYSAYSLERVAPVSATQTTDYLALSYSLSNAGLTQSFVGFYSANSDGSLVAGQSVAVPSPAYSLARGTRYLGTSVLYGAGADYAAVFGGDGAGNFTVTTATPFSSGNLGPSLDSELAFLGEDYDDDPGDSTSPFAREIVALTSSGVTTLDQKLNQLQFLASIAPAYALRVAEFGDGTPTFGYLTRSPGAAALQTGITTTSGGLLLAQPYSLGYSPTTLSYTNWNFAPSGNASPSPAPSPSSGVTYGSISFSPSFLQFSYVGQTLNFSATQIGNSTNTFTYSPIACPNNIGSGTIVQPSAGNFSVTVTSPSGTNNCSTTITGLGGITAKFNMNF